MERGLRKTLGQRILAAGETGGEEESEGRDGVVRCERCGSEEGPFDVHHTAEGYRYLGEELDRLDLLDYWCRACHEFRHGHGPDPMVPASWEELERRIRRLCS